MSEIIISLHIFSGIAAILFSIAPFFSKLNKLAVYFWPSVSIVSTTGVGLIFMGASLVRVCASGIILTVSLVLIRYVANRKLAYKKF